MTARLFNPWKEKSASRCAIGRHKVKLEELFVVADGKPLCRTHVLEIVSVIDSFYSSTTTRAQIVAAYRKQWKEKADKERAEEMRRIARTREPGFVYYIRMDDLIKIGYAKDVAQRMRAYPPSAELLAVHPGTREVERQMHQDFRAFLRRGREWFEPHAKVMEHIESIRGKFGDPSRFAYSYRKVG